MSGQNPDYIPLGQIQQQFWDKLSSTPLAGGKLEFFHDNARSVPKSVYNISGAPGSYQYVDIGSVITLSSIGTVDDGLGNNIQCFLYPFVESGLPGEGTEDLYYIVVTNSGGQFQFSSEGQPYISTSTNPISVGTQQNYISNGQFLLGKNSGAITALITNVAYGPWQYIHSSNSATDTVTFDTFTAPLNGNPSGNPRYACRVACSVTHTGDTQKVLQIVFQDVNRFSSATQQFTLFFSGKNNSTGSISLNANLYKNFGTGGSTPINTTIGTCTFTDAGYSNVVLPFYFGSNYGKTLGSSNDDYFAIQVEFPPTSTFDVSVTDFALFLDNVAITSYPFTLNPIPTFDIVTQEFTTSGTYTPTPGMFKCTIECWGGGGGGGGSAGYATTVGGSAGGGAGGYSRKTVSAATIGASQTVTIGALGAGGAAGSASTGGTGGATSVGTLCIANGGSGATGTGVTSNYTAGLGGAAGTGDIAGPGQNGGPVPMSIDSNNEYGNSSWGGSTSIGSGGASINSGNTIKAGSPGTGYGSGGAGVVWYFATGSVTGGNGAPGFVSITEYVLY